MQQLHLDACNPSAVRAEVTCCSYPTGVLARRYGSAPRPAASGASLGRTIASTTRPVHVGCVQSHSGADMGSSRAIKSA